MQSKVAGKMEYIQRFFLQVRDYMQERKDLDEVIAFLDSQPIEFRSIGYECASMMVGLRVLNNEALWTDWLQFYEQSNKTHSFHMDIGLGWAFAKRGVSPEKHRKALHPVIRLMVYDGLGYYHGLFHGRKTVKSQQIPAVITEQNTNGFDQGLGRRLWYIAQGNVDSAKQLLESFHADRQENLWRGLGIACGYVGGTNKTDLQLLMDSSASYMPHLATGIALAAVSRYSSNSITSDLEMACEIICRMPLTAIMELASGMQSKIASDPDNAYVDFIDRLELVYT